MGFLSLTPQPKQDKALASTSSPHAFPIIVAWAQLGCAVIAIWAWTQDKWVWDGAGSNTPNVVPGSWWVAAFMILGYCLGPVTLVSSFYYFVKYRADPPYRKWLVGLGLAAALLTWGIVYALR